MFSLAPLDSRYCFSEGQDLVSAINLSVLAEMVINDNKIQDKQRLLILCGANSYRNCLFEPAHEIMVLIT